MLIYLKLLFHRFRYLKWRNFKRIHRKNSSSNQFLISNTFLRNQLNKVNSKTNLGINSFSSLTKNWILSNRLHLPGAITNMGNSCLRWLLLTIHLHNFHILLCLTTSRKTFSSFLIHTSGALLIKIKTGSCSKSKKKRILRTIIKSSKLINNPRKKITHKI